MRVAEFMVLLCLLSLAFDGSDAAARMAILTATGGSRDLSKPEKDNNSSAEEKRAVPTGPNPLHNR